VPQVTLEYTDNIDEESISFHQLFAELHRALVDAAGVDIGNCKSRAVRLGTYCIGEGEPSNAFVHLAVGILEGRSAEVRRKLSERCLAVLKRHLARALDERKLQVTVEVREMARETYLKTISE
jgi:5-carboxymethyl-2-hydroxymuconate isomerase